MGMAWLYVYIYIYVTCIHTASKHVKTRVAVYILQLGQVNRVCVYIYIHVYAITHPSPIDKP